MPLFLYVYSFYSQMYSPFVALEKEYNIYSNMFFYRRKSL